MSSPTEPSRAKDVTASYIFDLHSDAELVARLAEAAQLKLDHDPTGAERAPGSEGMEAPREPRDFYHADVLALIIIAASIMLIAIAVDVGSCCSSARADVGPDLDGDVWEEGLPPCTACPGARDVRPAPY